MKKADSAESSLHVIDSQWRRFQIKSMFCYTLLICVCELIGYFVMNRLGVMEVNIPIYMLKYVLFPSSCNALLTAASWLITEKTGLPGIAKNYIVCLSMAGMAFVISVVHCTFSCVYSVFLIPVIMTTIYGRIRLTSVVALVCALLDWLSAMNIRWDSSKAMNANLMADFMLSQFLLVGAFIACTVIIRFEKEKQRVIAHSEQERCRLQQELLQDNLTGVYNRLALDGEMETLRTSSEKEPFVAMMDIDNFKSINDVYGHIEGDAVLHNLGKVLKENCPDAVLIRFGGDEFIALFQDVKQEEALNALENVQCDFERYCVEGDTAIHPTLSIGLAAWQPEVLPETILRYADEALYQSKLGKKNRITVYHPQSEEK